MKKGRAKREDKDDLRPEYDFSKLKGAVRGKYYKRYLAGKNLLRFKLIPVPNELVPEVEALIARAQKA